MKKLLLILGLLFSASASWANTTYYLDAAVGNDGNAGTSPGSGNAWATFAKAMVTVSSGDFCWVKGSGSYLEIATTSINAIATANITFAGYTTTPGDNGFATIDGNNSQINNIVLKNSWYSFQNLKLTGAKTGPVNITVANNNNYFINCVLSTGTASPTKGFYSSTFVIGSDYQIINCLISGFGTNSLSSLLNLIVSGCTINKCGPIAMSSAGAGITVLSSLFNGSVGNSISIQASDQDVLIEGNTFNNSSTSALGISATSISAVFVVNNIFSNNAAYGIACPFTNGLYNDYNAFYANTSGNSDNNPVGPHAVILSADPFTNAAGGDFSLNSTAGGGASVRAAGFPSSFQGTITNSYPDIGASQHQATGGTAATVGYGYV